jgi:EAL domain-containing protein (putative c-di-GMP-specific phosphodiesterase class I)
MGSLTRWVLDQALAQCARWREAGSAVAMSVNISATNLLDAGFAALVEELLRRHELEPDALVLEITETSLITEFERAKTVVCDLQERGVVVSIDDFGTGFTSLAYLSNLAVGELKLDRSFVSRLTGSDSDRDLELVRSTIALGHALRMRAVAEGIEDAETLEVLAGLDCDLAQGYFIGMPEPTDGLPLPSREAPPVAPARGRDWRGLARTPLRRTNGRQGTVGSFTRR